MRIDIITLFPDVFEPVLNTSMLKKARDENLVEINAVNLRQFGLGKRQEVDGTPYGGGDGMVLRPEPVFGAVESVQTDESEVVMLSPKGVTYSQPKAEELSQKNHLILVCGRYEGFDERILNLADRVISIGDYVLTGGEVPAMVVTESVVRLIPGVLGGETSAENESFSDGQTIEYPQYTKPREFRGMEVPEVLLSGDHGKIAEWRRKQARKRTESLNNSD